MSQREHDHVIMVGASFDEVREEARKVAKVELDKEVQRVESQVASALETAHKGMTCAVSINKRLRIQLYITGGLCGVEAGVIIVLLRWYLRHP